MLTNFDAPSRDECVAFRSQSNSPQQALTLLNDPVFVEASRALATRIVDESNSSKFETWIETAFALAVARKPKPAEIKGLSKLYKTQTEYFEANPKDAESFLANGRFSPKIELSNAQFAALGQVCRVILNLHETITRY
jgi:hypothetical protein